MSYLHMKRVFLLLLYITSLFIGGIIYILLRPDSLLMFDWIKSIGLDKIVTELRKLTLANIDLYPSWLVYSSPSGLWIFSYLGIILLIWRDQNLRYSILWILLVPSMSFIAEFLQLFGLLCGRFDIHDILSLSFGIVLAIVTHTCFKTQII